MRLIPRSLSDILHPTSTPNLKRAVPVPACHGIGCLSIPAAPTTDCSGDACGIKAKGKAATPAPTVTITQSITIHVNVTFYQTSWLTAYDTILSTVQHNNTITVTQTETQNFTSKMTEMHTATATQLLDTSKSNSTVPVTAAQQQQQQKGGLNAGDILAIVLGVLLVVMAVGGFFMYRGLSRKRREERVLRKQLQTEGTELKSGDAKDGDGLGGSEMEEWAGPLRG